MMRVRGFGIILAVVALSLGGCGSDRGMKKADSNAGSNAAAAGLGALVYGLITDDKRAVEKAAATAAATATVTKVREGSQTVKEEAEWERVIGPQNTDGLVALIGRDYRAAKDAFDEAGQSDNATFRRVSVKLLALMYYDTGNDESLEPLLAKIVESDAAIANDAEARNDLGRHSAKLAELRKEYE